jgi:3-oxoacyl-[acyl-carrier protein] reductase
MKHMSEQIHIIIVGGGSNIARNVFVKKKDYEINAFSKFSDLKSIKEYKTHRYKKVDDITKFISKIKSKKIVLLFMENLSISNLIVNKTDKELLKEVDTNLINPHKIIKKVLPVMIKNNWGRIIFSGSSRALKGDTGISGYSICKYALVGYTRVLSKEYARFGITTNYLSLGIFDSKLSDSLKKSTKKNLIKNTDTGSMGDFQSVYNAINFIINSKYVSGAIIPVNGGFN